MTELVEPNRRGLLAGALTVAATLPAVGFAEPARAATPNGGIEPNSVLAKVRQNGTLHMGYAQTAPWFYKDVRTGKLQGIYFEVAEALCRQMQVKPSYQEVSWADTTQALQRGDFDIFVSSLTYTTPRATSICYPTPPLWQRGSLALINKSNAKRFKTAADLNNPNVTIAVNVGTSSEAQAKRLFPKAKLLETTGEITTATEPVRTGRADAWLNGDNDVIAFAHKNSSWAMPLDPDHPFDVAPNTWAIRYGDPTWESFISGWGNYAVTNGLVKRAYDRYTAMSMKG